MGIGMTAAHGGQLVGIGLIAAGALCWSTAGVAARGVSVDSWEVTFWRSFFLMIAVFPVLWSRRRQVILDARLAGWAMLASGMLMGTAFVCFILAILHTPVANVLFVMACSPLLTAAIGRMFFQESISRRTGLAILAAAFGVAIMVRDSLKVDGLFGAFMAFVVALSFSINANLVRHHRRVSMLPSVFLAGLFSMIIVAPWALPTSPSPRDFALLAFLGFIQLGLGMVLYMAGARRVSAARAMIVGLLEIVFGPIWVWLVFGEKPTFMALAGGVIVVAAVATDMLMGSIRMPGDAR